MKFCILTLFPEMFRGFVDDSVLKRGQESGVIEIETRDIRDYSTDKHRRVDDTIFGGGAGMLLKPEPLAAAISAAREKMPDAQVIYLSPSGAKFTQRKAEQLAANGQDLILLCGRYEGIDQRVRATMIDEEISIGDYVLSGGEIAAATVVDAVARLVPGVVGKETSTAEESFSRRLFRQAEFPQFTKPRNWQGLTVPEVLLSGDHAAIEKWQLEHLPGLSSCERQMLHVRQTALPRKTKNLFLRNQEDSDIDSWVEWFNDEEVVQFTSISKPLSREDEEAYFDAAQGNLHLLPISICERKTKRPIGVMALEKDTNNPQSASFGIIIGDKSNWGRGFGREALREMLIIAFTELGLERVHLDVFTENDAAIRCYEACGFQRIGLARKKYFLDDGFHDGYLYEIVREDFINS